MDVTYIHIPGFGWWYAVTVIDYYWRYLLAAYLTPSYSALAATEALALARQEAERLCGPLVKPPFLVTDNGSTFIANVNAEYHTDPASIRDWLYRQVFNPVRWQACVERLIADGCEAAWEIGPNKVLSGLLRKIDRTVPMTLVGKASDLETEA